MIASHPKWRGFWQLAGKHGEKRTSWTLVTLILDPVLLVNHHSIIIKCPDGPCSTPKRSELNFSFLFTQSSSQYIYIFIYQRILSPQYLTAPKNPWFSNEVYSIHISIQWGLFLGWFLVPGIHVVPWFTVRSPVIYDYHIATKKKMPKGEKSLEMSDYMYEISSN